MGQHCLFCGGDASEPDHILRCDGRQGRREADADDLPPLMSGIVPATFETSAAAACSVDDTKDQQRQVVFAAIKAAGPRGCTDDELQIALGLSGNSERPRRWELWKLNQIRIQHDADGNAVRRLTRANRRAVVWVAA